MVLEDEAVDGETRSLCLLPQGALDSASPGLRAALVDQSPVGFRHVAPGKAHPPKGNGVWGSAQLRAALGVLEGERGRLLSYCLLQLRLLGDCFTACA